MNPRIKKFLLVVLAVALLAAGGFTQRSMNQDRKTLGLTRLERPLDNMPPVLAFTTVALGGFRGLISNVLWIRANDLQMEDKFFEMSQLAEWITKLEPHFTQVWLVQAWNMAYNISVKFKENAPGDYTDRWRWVQRGIDLLHEGLKYNPNDLLIYRELAWFFQHKIGANLDDGHMFYKRQWIIETSKVFGSTNKVSLEALAHPTDEDTRRRAALMRSELKMDPQTVLEVDKQYGPLDWRMPETYAIYWAHVGLQKAKEHPDRVKKDDIITLRRVIYQCMQLAFQRGRLVPNYFLKRFEYAPNLDLIPKVNAAYEEQMKEDPKMAAHIGNGYRNWLRDAVYFLYIHNREAEAAKWYKMLSDKYPNKTIVDDDTNSFPRNLTLDQYVFDRFKEAMGETSERGMKNVLEGLITQSYINLINDQDDRAAGFMHLARKEHAWYQSKVSASRSGQINMPPLRDIQQDVLKRMLDPETGLTDEAAAQLATKLGVPLPPRVKKPASESQNGSATTETSGTSTNAPAAATNAPPAATE